MRVTEGSVYRLKNTEWCERCPPKPCWLHPGTLAIVMDVGLRKARDGILVPTALIADSKGCQATIDQSRLEPVSVLEALAWSAG